VGRKSIGICKFKKRSIYGGVRVEKKKEKAAEKGDANSPERGSQGARHQKMGRA
jgi:hypothetical protein